MATVNDIISRSLRLLKVKDAGEPVDGTEALDALDVLNEIIEQMNLQDYFQTAKVQLTQSLTASDGQYTFGTGGDNSTRPVKIYNAYIKDGSIDHPVRIISNEEYSSIPYKTVTSTHPYNLYFRSEYPLAKVELYPVPSKTTTLYLECMAALSTYSDTTDAVTLPPGYTKYLAYQLAIDLQPEYKTNADPAIYEGAREAKELIKRANLKDKPVMLNTARMAIKGSHGGYLFGTV